MPYTPNRASYLTNGTIPLATAGWYIRNLEPEIVGRSIRGSNRQLTHAPGERWERKRVDEHVFQFELVVKGLVKWDGTTYSDPKTGFVTNCLELTNNLGIGSFSPQTWTWHLADGSTTKTAIGDVVGFHAADIGTKRDGLVALEILIPAGVFA